MRLDSRWTVTAAVGLAVGGVLAGCRPDPVAEARAAAPRPNVLLVVIDCLRADHMGVYGYHRDTTPNLDALAAESVRFSRATSQASWTRPSLPTLLTGLYPSEHGLFAFGVDQEGVATSAALAPEERTLAEELATQGYATAMIGTQMHLAPRFGLNQGFETYHHQTGTSKGIGSLFWNWLGSVADRPFFAYLHYLDIHWPYCPPDTTAGTFDDGSSDLETCRGWRKLRDGIQSGAVVPSDADRRRLEARYDEELLALDLELGDLFDRLRSEGRWDETLVVLTGDHGEEFWDHGSVDHGQSLYQELLGVPLLFKPVAAWQAQPGRVIDSPVEIRQVMATVLDATAGAVADDAGAPVVSLLPWILGADPTNAPAEFVIAESGDQVAVRSGRWKLVAKRDGSAYELYDLETDPRETTDLSARERRRLAELKGFLHRWQSGLRPAPGEAPVAMDEETVQGLKALGYLGE